MIKGSLHKRFQKKKPRRSINPSLLIQSPKSKPDSNDDILIQTVYRLESAAVKFATWLVLN